MLQVENSLRYRSWKVDEQEMALVVQVVLAAFIHDTHEVILGGPRIRNDPVDLAWNEATPCNRCRRHTEQKVLSVASFYLSPTTIRLAQTSGAPLLGASVSSGLLCAPVPLGFDL